jgi:nicotinamide phosphoribosyltransferase
MNKNILLMTDSYKLSHWKQYPPKTEKVYSYFESRGGKFPKTMFFGLQYFLKEYLEGNVVTKEKINEAEEFAKAHFGRDDCFNREGWEYILNKYNGRLPVSIKAVPEGTLVDNHNVLMTIENTDPRCWWLTNYLETLLVQVWYPSTVATQSYYMKEIILKYLEKTGDPSLIDFKLHDFGFRGSTSVESAGLGDAAHLINFKGTDTIAGILLAREYYGENMAGFSIPASEHSTITAWGKENECKAFANMLKQYPEGMVACVSDSYDIFKACEEYWGTELRQKVIERSGTLVVRPDSGNPPEVVVAVLNMLGNKFGDITNKKGYRILPPFLRVIQGDGIDYEMLEVILYRMKERGWSADNIAFGSGGGLLQKVNRDTQKFAFKCSSVTIDGIEKDVWKDPVTSKGKKSKAGRMILAKSDNGTFATVSPTDEIKDQLIEVFRNGKILKEYSFDEIRKEVKR